MTTITADFDGQTYEPDQDHARLAKSLERVQAIVADQQWHTLSELAQAVGSSEAGVSARLRDLRKEKFGGHTVERRRVSGGLWEYRYLP